MAPTPLLVIGRTMQIGTVVTELLKPEYEVIHFMLGADAAKKQMPPLLRGESVTSDTELGTKDYSRPPVAVILGAGYSDDDVADIMKTAGGIRPMPWLQCDTTKPTPPLGPEYGKTLVMRVKELLGKLKAEGKMDEEAVRWY
ncbi:hypothetical protein F5Y16DRAFT_404750 [Xylariaceae sp. FL0255]|nr:hypothetical protein F5Y16DRAFT_404750 [Xylariaceae sp. FL0255]